MAANEAPLAAGGNVWVPPKKSAWKVFLWLSAAAVALLIIPLFFYQEYPNVAADGKSIDLAAGTVAGQQASIFFFRLLPNLLAVILLAIAYVLYYLSNRHSPQGRRSSMIRGILVLFIGFNLFTGVRTLVWEMQSQSEWVAQQLGSTATGIAFENGLPVDVTNWQDGSTHTVTLSDGVQETFNVIRTSNSIVGLSKPGDEVAPPSGGQDGILSSPQPTRKP